MACWGEGCRECNNQGFVSQEPAKYKQDEVFNAWKWLKKYNMLPFPGVWTQQSARFVKTVDFLDAVAGRWGQMIERRNQATKALAKRLINGKK